MAGEGSCTPAGVGAASSYASVLRKDANHEPNMISKDDTKMAERDSGEGEEVTADLTGKQAQLNPTRPVVGEVLPPELFRSCTGFLLSKQAASFTLKVEKLQKEIDFLSKMTVIAYFVGGSFSGEAQRAWLNSLERNKRSVNRIGRDLGFGYFQIIVPDDAASQKLLALTPHISKWGTCIL